jgi:hypothetical protein
VERGLAQIERGDVLSHAEVGARLETQLAKKQFARVDGAPLDRGSRQRSRKHYRLFIRARSDARRGFGSRNFTTPPLDCLLFLNAGAMARRRERENWFFRRCRMLWSTRLREMFFTSSASCMAQNAGLS